MILRKKTSYRYRKVSVIATAIALILSANFFVSAYGNEEMIGENGAERGIPAEPVYYAGNAQWNERNYLVEGTGDGANWSYVYFGSYPQSETKDAGIMNKIDQVLGGKEATGDVTVDGVRYRKVKYKEANKHDRSTWGTGTPDYRYFIWEPLKWKVLHVDMEMDRMLLFSAKVIDCQEFHETDEDVYWETSDIRRWLNGGSEYRDPDRPYFTGNGFLMTAFNEQERAAIRLTSLDNPRNPRYRNKDDGKTADRLFLLSLSDATNPAYGFTEWQKDSLSRGVNLSQYALAMGADQSEQGDYLYAVADPDDTSTWWLRTRGISERNALVVGFQGYLGTDGWKASHDGGEGIAPAMYIDFSSDLWKITDPKGFRHTVTFDGNGVTLLDDHRTTRADGRLVGFPPVCRFGYTFEGWFTAKEGGSLVTQDAGISEDTTLYAHWKKDETAKTVQQDDTGKVDPKPEPKPTPSEAGVKAPDKAVIKSVKNKKKKSVIVKISLMKDAAGFEICYSTTKKFKNGKATKTLTTSKTSVKLKNLKKGKMVYIKVRAFTTDASGNRIYGAYSKVRKIKVKK